MKFKKIVKIALSLPRSILFNIRYLPFSQALKMPIMIANNLAIRQLYRGGVLIKSDEIYLGMIRIGYHQVGAIDTYSAHTIIDIGKKAKLIFKDDAHIGQGAIINVKGNGVLTCGKNFAISGTTSIICSNKIDIGDNVQFSWDTLVMDSDAHHIIDNRGVDICNTAPIRIGNNVWIAARNLILKGTTIGNNCVVGASSVLNKNYNQDNVIIAGSPAKCIKEISRWRL